MDTKLTNALIKRVFMYLKSTELLNVRLVNKKFNTIAQEILNNSLFDMNEKLTDVLETVNQKLQDRSVSQNTLRYFKITNYLRSEINLIIATSFVYMKEGHYSFGGACILDFYRKFLRLKYNEIENFEYITIYHMIESYLNNFDDKVESRIIKDHKEYQNAWFGMKLMNLLDSSLNLNFKIELSNSSNDIVLVDGKYFAKDLHLLENVPLELKTDAEKRTLIQTIRNNIRWCNLLYCIERSTGELSKVCLEPGQHLIHRNSTVYEKSNSEKWQEDQIGVYYKANVKCHRSFLPLRASSILAQSAESLTVKRNLSITVNEKAQEYPFELNLLMKTRTRVKDKVLEKMVKILNIDNTCIIKTD